MLPKKSLTAALVAGALLVPGIAVADQVRSSVAAQGTTSIQLSGGTGSTSIDYEVQKTGNACDPATGSPALVTIVVGNNAAGSVTVTRGGSPLANNRLTFSACDVKQSVAFRATASGQYPVTASVSDADNPSDTYTVNQATFTLVVQQPANTAPSVSVSGVASGAEYQIGSVPAASCNVADAEDGNKTVAATVSAVSGPLAAYGLGSQTASCTYQDAGNLTAGDSRTYSIVDLIKPGLATPGDLTREATGADGASVTYAQPTASDNLQGLGAPSCTPASSTEFPVGVTTVNCSVTDVAGNTTSGSFKVTVQDTTAPSLTVGSDVRVEATGPDGAKATYDAATATDAVSGSLSPSCAPPSGSVFAMGKSDVTCSVSDGAGNSADGKLTVEVVDTTAPTLHVPADVTVEATGLDGATVPFTVTAKDLVDGDVTPACDVAGGATFGLGTQTVSCTATDAEGNQSSGSFRVTVQDTTDPALTLPKNVTAEATDADGAVATFTATATDTADEAPVVSCIPPSGSTFPIGSTTVSCTAEDASGNQDSGSFMVTVVDTTAPEVSTSGDQVLEATGPDGAAADFTSSAADTVDGAVDTTCTTLVGAVLTGDTFPLGTLTVTCAATDAAGNTGSGSFTVTVQDTTAPTLSLKAEEVAEATGADGAKVTYTATADDIVDGDVTPTCWPESGSTFQLGITTVSCSATDAAGNEAEGSFSVIVEDTSAPVLTVPEDATVEATGPDGAAYDYSATAEDIVDGSVTPECAPESGATFALGATTVDCSASDSRGNTAGRAFTVTVEDTTPPVVTVPGDLTEEAAGPNGSEVDFASSAADLVSGDLPTTCKVEDDVVATGARFPLGASTVTCAATDAAGNTGHSSFVITVQDTTAPVVKVPDTVTEEATGPNGAAVAFQSSAEDLVDGAVSTTCREAGQVVHSGDVFALGSHDVQCRATDKAGNTGSAGFVLTVQDTTGPAVTVPGNIVKEATGPAGAAATFAASASDLVDGAVAVICAPESGSTFALGTATVSCSATDSRGNASSKPFTVTVRDTTAPALSLPSRVSGQAATADGVALTYAATASDVVDGSVPVTCSPTSGSVFAPGTRTVQCSATDTAGNRATGSFDAGVTFGWNGFFAPVDNNGVLNSIKGGQTVPLKWNIPNGNGGWISSLSVVKPLATAEISCASSSTLDDVETTATGGTSLRYDSTANQYIYNWQTPKTVGKCYRVTVALTDGSSHTALFKTK